MCSHAVLARLFGPQRLSFLQTIVNEEVDAILSGLEQRAGEWDAVADFAKPLPVSAAYCKTREVLIALKQRHIGYCGSFGSSFVHWDLRFLTKTTLSDGRTS